MRTIPAIIVVTLLAGANTLATPGIAEARFGTARAVSAAQPGQISTQFSAQRRTQRAPRRAATPRTSGNPVTTIESTYRDPSSRGALLNCSFC